MKDSEDWQRLIGQLAADALIRDALIVSLMEVIPSLHSRLESKVAATAPAVGLRLAPLCAETFQDRLSEVRAMLANASGAPDAAMG